MPSATETTAPRRVLVVDDNESSAMTLSWAMEMYGYEVRVCHDGYSAVELAQAFIPEVVLLDLSMPAMDGFEVCKKIRNEPGLCGTRVIAQTGLGDEDTRKRTADVGFDHHLVKPLDLNQVRAVIEQTAVPLSES